MDQAEDFFAAKARLIWDNLPKGPAGRTRRGALQEISRATGGVVSGQYLRQLTEGRFANPGADKLAAIAKALGFPVDWWWLPVEAGPPPMGEEGRPFRDLLARLLALSPARRAEVFRQIAHLLDEAEARGGKKE